MTFQELEQELDHIKLAASGDYKEAARLLRQLAETLDPTSNAVSNPSQTPQLHYGSQPRSQDRSEQS